MRGPRHPKLYESGLFLVVVATPLAFIPFSTSPFADLKLVVLALGVILLWASSPPVDRTIAILAGLWLGASVLGGLFGIDPGRSITGTENSPGGVALVLLCAYLVSVGAAMPRGYRERLPLWVAATASVVATVVIIWRIWPGAFSSMPGLRFSGSTLGDGVFMAAFLSLGLLALPHVRISLWLSVAGAGLFGLALGGTPHRLALISTIVGFAFGVWHSGVSRKRAATIAAVASVAFMLVGLWPSSGPAVAVPRGGGTSAIERGLGNPSIGYRLSQLSAVVRGTGERPIFGWGPGNTLSAWLAGAAPADLPAEEQFTDAHDIFVEQLSATGFLGIPVFLAMVGMLALRILKRPRPTGWLAGAVVTLVLLHLVEPMNVATTSLGFLLVGIAASREEAALLEPSGGRRMTRAVSGVLLAGTLVISILTLTSAFMEQYEHTYYAPDHEGLWLATRITPWRIKSSADLATQLALDGRAGNEARGAQALELVQQMLEEHPWYPGVYHEAVLVHKLVMDPEGAVPVIEAFEQRFPLLPPPAVDIGPVALSGSAG